MTHYHLMIQSKPNTANAQKAREFVHALHPVYDQIIQVYFYYEGVFQAADAEISKDWLVLVPQKGVLKVCQTYLERWDLTIMSGFVKSGLVDFFLKHWQDQGKLLQF
jgi:hypothetical protein